MKQTTVIPVHEIHAQTNNRMYARNLPTHPLQPVYDVRAVPTRQIHMPLVDCRAPTSVSVTVCPTFDPRQCVAPGGAPWSGWAARVNDESTLRNQVYAHQRASQSVYVPSTTSDLYDHRVPVRTTPGLHSAHPHLYAGTERAPQSSPGVGSTSMHHGGFHQHTRAAVYGADPRRVEMGDADPRRVKMGDASEGRSRA